MPCFGLGLVHSICYSKARVELRVQPTHYQLTPRMPLSWPALQWRAVAALKCQQRSKVEGGLLRLLHRQQALAWSQWRAWVQYRWAQGGW